MTIPPPVGAARRLTRKVSANGQITLGALYAGRVVELERFKSGILLRFVEAPPSDSPFAVAADAPSTPRPRTDAERQRMRRGVPTEEGDSQDVSVIDALCELTGESFEDDASEYFGSTMEDEPCDRCTDCQWGPFSRRDVPSGLLSDAAASAHAPFPRSGPTSAPRASGVAPTNDVVQPRDE